MSLLKIQGYNQQKEQKVIYNLIAIKIWFIEN